MWRAKVFAMSVPTGQSAVCGLPCSTTEALRPLGVVLDDLDSLTDRLVRSILKLEPAYAELTFEARQAVRSSLRESVELWIRALTGSVPDGADLVEIARETGRMRARQGLRLEAVLRACRLGGRIIWDALLVTSRERFAGRYDTALLDAASDVWRLIDHSSSALAEAYQLEEARLSDENRRYGFLAALLDGSGDDHMLVREAANALGLPEEGPLVCVVAPTGSSGDLPLLSPGEVLDAHGIVSSWHSRPAEIVGLVALEDRTRDSVLDVLRAAVAGPTGASPVMDGLVDAPAAYEMALTAARTLHKPGLVSLDDRLPEALLLGNPGVADRLPAVALGKLPALPNRERATLLRTLEALLVCNGSATHAAQRLYCHRNTVLYRLQRIETTTGRTISRPRDRLLLALGLMALRTREA